METKTIPVISDAPCSNLLQAYDQPESFSQSHEMNKSQ